MPPLGPIAKTQISRFPEVTAVVVGDPAGALVEFTGAIDGESSAAVIAVVVRSLNSVGEHLGLGMLKRATLTGNNLALVIAVTDHEALGVYVDPSKPLGAFEKKLDTALNR